MCTVKEFSLLVRDMRNAQNEYFRTRSSYALTNARSLERKVDGIIAATDFTYFEKQQAFIDRLVDLSGSLMLAFSELKRLQGGIFAEEGTPEAKEALEHSDMTISSITNLIDIHNKNRK
jgi:hypothetical protein